MRRVALDHVALAEWRRRQRQWRGRVRRVRALRPLLALDQQVAVAETRMLVGLFVVVPRLVCRLGALDMLLQKVTDHLTNLELELSVRIATELLADAVVVVIVLYAW